MECTKNGQSAALNLSNEQLQVILTGKFGDGCLSTPKTCEISSILNKYPVNCYNYKIWSSETIQNWSKLQEQLKSVDSKDFSTRKIAAMLKRIENESLL